MQFMWWIMIETHKINIHRQGKIQWLHLLQATDRWAEVVDGEEQALWHVKSFFAVGSHPQERESRPRGFSQESCLDAARGSKVDRANWEPWNWTLKMQQQKSGPRDLDLDIFFEWAVSISSAGRMVCCGYSFLCRYVPLHKLVCTQSWKRHPCILRKMWCRFGEFRATQFPRTLLHITFCSLENNGAKWS